MIQSNAVQTTDRKVRFAVVGLGHIAQVAVLPAFGQAENAELAALVSGDKVKLDELGSRYQVPILTDYDEYPRLLSSGDIDAVYIAVPNHLHCEYSVAAATARVHVLCEKPMAVTEEECWKMAEAAQASDTRLMIAYRLHFEHANLEAIEIARSGELGEVRFFDSVFSQSVKAGDVRLVSTDKGGGPVYDMGVYCINAARYLFQDEPTLVSAVTAKSDDARFAETEEMAAVTLGFPGGKLATFTCSFGAEGVSTYRLVGTRGQLCMERAYKYAQGTRYSVNTKHVSRTAEFGKRDQFAPELAHFSNCVLRGAQPEPGADDGIADVRVVNAIHRAASTGRSVSLDPVPQFARPGMRQARLVPGFEKPEEIHASGPGAR